MKNLTIQHLAIAFANGQKVRFFDAEREKWHSCRITELRDGEMTIVSEDYEYDVYFSEVLLIVRPLSDLTKEIEHNGERFVPIEYGCNGLDLDLQNLEREIRLNKSFSKQLIIGEHKFKTVNKLFQWHFDCFSLLENNLAVNYNDIYK